MRDPAAAADSARFVRDAHAIVRDLMTPDLRVYWTDFLVTIGIAYATLAIYLRAVSTPPAVEAFAFVICALAMYRAVVFIHEITHHRGPAFAAFTLGWNVLCGIPFLLPAFLYGNHHGHHGSDTYGTWSDPEYILHGPEWRFKVTVFLLLPLLYPVLILIRFVLLTPMALLSARVNRFVWTHGSSLYVMNESYRRDYDDAAVRRSRWVQEVACSAWAWLLTGLVLSGHIGMASVARVYLVFLFWMALNQVRTLAAHRYRSEASGAVSYLEQLLDTNTFPRGGWLPELWAPVGLRYHALHHLLPFMPYHSMGTAHRRLMQRLPPDAPYRQTVRPGLSPVLSALLRDREAAMRPAPTTATAEGPRAPR